MDEQAIIQNDCFICGHSYLHEIMAEWDHQWMYKGCNEQISLDMSEGKISIHDVLHRTLKGYLYLTNFRN